MTITAQSTKNEMIADIKNKIALKIFEPETGEFIISLINKAESLDEAFNVYQLGTNYTKTGLHYEVKKEKLSDTIKYLKKDDFLSFINNNNTITHKLIVGDNYPALQNLLIQYHKDIDVIYIDPPYGKDSMGQFADTNYNNSLTRDNLLSMLYTRVSLSRQLLKKEGVIFVSIDDKNQAYVKCLLDDVFGEQNFVCNLIWTNNEGGGGSDSKNFKVKHEYILCYANSNPNAFETKKVDIEDLNRYTLSDEFLNERGKYQLVKLASASIQYSASLDYKIEMPDGSFIEPSQNTDKDRACWRWSKSKLQWGLDNKFVVFKKDKKGIWQVYTKQYTNCDKDGNIVERTKIPLALIDRYSSTQASEYLVDIFDSKVFSYPKPVELIEWLIDRIDRKDIKVLDFFAGSGTTGEAVLNLNKKDGGNREFILVQLDEDLDLSLATAKTDKNKYLIENQIKLCDLLNRPHRLSEITCERLRRIMLGSSLNNTLKFKWIDENTAYGDNLEVVNVVGVSNKEVSNSKSAFDVIDETLYGLPKFENIRDKIEWVVNNFENTQYKLED